VRYWPRKTSAIACPVTLAEAKLHLRVDHTDEDTYIQTLIEAATGWAEEYTGRAFSSSTWVKVLPEFPSEDEIILERAPLISVTSVVYRDEDNAAQTMAAADYQVDTRSEPGKIVLAKDTDWPDTYERIDAVAVTFTAGYSTVPAGVKQAILLMVGHMYAHREEVTVGVTSQSLAGGAEKRLLALYQLHLV
jgi:uncharacterized phiE125 gp8 family phage protein